MAFNYSAYSDSSDDSHHQNFSIKLSDLGIGATSDVIRPQHRKIAEKPETAETKELAEAFRNIDGPPAALQHALEREKMKALLAGNPRRLAPPPPTFKSEESKPQVVQSLRTTSRQPPIAPSRRRQLEDVQSTSHTRHTLSHHKESVPYSPLKPADPATRYNTHVCDPIPRPL